MRCECQKQGAVYSGVNGILLGAPDETASDTSSDATPVSVSILTKLPVSNTRELREAVADMINTSGCSGLPRDP